MANLMDIYYKVGKSLYEKEFDFKTIEEKKVLVEGNLKNYVAGKIAEESTTKAIELSNNPKVSLDELEDKLTFLMEDIQKNMYNMCLENTKNRTTI